MSQFYEWWVDCLAESKTIIKIMIILHFYILLFRLEIISGKNDSRKFFKFTYFCYKHVKITLRYLFVYLFYMVCMIYKWETLTSLFSCITETTWFIIKQAIGGLVTHQLILMTCPLAAQWELVPANTIHWTNAGWVFGRRRRRRPNIYPALGIVLTGHVIQVNIYHKPVPWHMERIQ